MPHNHIPDSSIPLRRCSGCQQDLPATREFFLADKSVKSGLRRRCRKCMASRWRSWYRRTVNPDARPYGTKRKAYDPEQRRAYYLANKEKVAEVSRVWYAKNRESALAKGRVWKSANRERIQQRRRVLLAKNPEKYRAQVNKRRALKIAAEGFYTGEDVQSQMARQKNRCYWCNVKLSQKYHVDHIVPLSRGGTNWPENLVIACVHCNEARGAKLPHEWPEGNRLL